MLEKFGPRWPNAVGHILVKFGTRGAHAEGHTLEKIGARWMDVLMDGLMD